MAHSHVIQMSLWSRLACPLAAVLALSAGVSQAQAPATTPATTPATIATPSTERPNPLDPLARVPASAYHSPLAAYRALGDDKRVPWKEANETVNRIGGWRVYLRQAQQPDGAASAPVPMTAPKPASTPGAAATPGALRSN